MLKLGTVKVGLALCLAIAAIGCGDDDGGSGAGGTGNSGTGGTAGESGTGGTGGTGGTSGTGGTGGTSGTGGTGGTSGTGGDAGEGTICEQAWSKIADCNDAGFDPGSFDAGVIGQCMGAFACFAQCQLDATCTELMNEGPTYQACVVACLSDGGVGGQN